MGAVALCFWLLLWCLAASVINEELFLPSPLGVVRALGALLREPSFPSSVAFSVSRVLIAYAFSFLAALLSGVLAGMFPCVKVLLSPLVKAMRSVPVASIVILALVWVKSRNLSMVVSFLVVFPILYQSVLTGMESVDPLLLEAAGAYRMTRVARVRYIYAPSVIPFVTSGAGSSLGLSWKSAVAAEVIALPSFSIGSGLYEAKVYLDTPSLFAWTVVIVALAFVFERGMMLLLSLMKKGIEK